MNSGQESKVTFDIRPKKGGWIDKKGRKFLIEIEAEIRDELKEKTGEFEVFLAACGDKK